MKTINKFVVAAALMLSAVSNSYAESFTWEFKTLQLKVSSATSSERIVLSEWHYDQSYLNITVKDVAPGSIELTFSTTGFHPQELPWIKVGQPALDWVQYIDFDYIPEIGAFATKIDRESDVTTSYGWASGQDIDTNKWVTTIYQPAYNFEYSLEYTGLTHTHTFFNLQNVTAKDFVAKSAYFDTRYNDSYAHSYFPVMPANTHHTIIATLVTAVPEPSTYAMLGLGLGIMGFTARRHKYS